MSLNNMNSNNNTYFINKMLGIFILICLSTGVSHSQKNINFERISTNEGLSQSDINCIYQDIEGFMWFGTFDGLNKYDGYAFTNYLPEPNNHETLSSNIIFAITGDKNGNLWIGTTGGGLNKFDKKTEKFKRFRHDKNKSTSLDSDFIRCVLVDNKNRLLVGTEKGLNLLDINNGESVFKHVKNELTTPIKTMYEDSLGDIWVSTNGQILKLIEDKNGEFELINVDYEGRLNDNLMNSLKEDDKGNLLLGGSRGLFIKEKSNKISKLIDLPNITIRTFEIDATGQYWIGTNNGIFQFEYSEENKQFEQKNHFLNDPMNPSSISKNIINVSYKDKTGIIWLGTNGGGINKIDPNKKQFQHIKRTSNPNSLSYDKIRSMFEDSNGNLWIGTEGGGLNVLKKEDDNGKFNKFKKNKSILKPFALEEVEINGKKMLLIGSGGMRGLYKLDLDNIDNLSNSDIKLFIPTRRTTFSILQDKNKTIWVGVYGGGIYRVVFEKNGVGYKIDNFAHDMTNDNSISDDIIRNIFQDKKGDIWFGTGNGLSRLPYEELLKDNPKFDVHRNVEGDSTSISHNYIMPIYESDKGELFIGTFGGGLNKYIPAKGSQKEGFKSYNLKDGLPNNVIKSILEDNSGNLWLSTNKGLSKFNPNTETFKNYDVNDGLQNNEFQELTGLKRKNGELLFGGINGFNVFNPENISDNTLPAGTVISKFSIFNEEIKVGEEYNGNVVLDSSITLSKAVDLKYNQNSFSIEFAGLHYAAPLKNQFSYILEGYDEKWNKVSSSNRVAKYTNIAPGNYTFKVKASNSDGIWDITPSELKLCISPPFWKTDMAYLLYALIGIGLLLAFRRFTVISTTRKHQFELDHLETEKKEELQRVKLEFFTNVSHEFRTPLTLIKGPLDYLIDAESTRDNVDVQEQCKVMRKNTDYLMRLVDQLLDFRKINQGKMRLVIRNTDIISFIKDIGEPFQFTAHKQNINFNIESPNKSIKAWFDHDALEKIIKNLLSNAFKFTPENEEITIVISKEVEKDDSSSDFVVIEVKNTGSDIGAGDIENIFDRFYTKTNKKKNTQRSSGIGLAFTKSLINFHQGTIEVKAEENETINFIVKLPRKKVAYEDIPEISIKEKTESDFLVRSSEKESIAIDLNDEIADSKVLNSRSKLPLLLVVDDNPDIRTFIVRALSSTFKVVEASDGKEGLEKACDLIPNIILTDVIMPVMDGIELCNQLKNRNDTSHIPIIMLTAKSSSESEIEGLKIGADGYMKKPFDLKVLKLKLNNILKYREELRRRFNREITLQPEEVVVTSLDEKFLQRAIEIVEKHMMNTDFSVELMVKEMGLSRSHLYIKFKELTGLSSSAFIRNIRLKRAVQLLEQNDFSVKEIMYMTGFNTSSYFSQCFKKQFGMLPRDYIKKLKDEKISSETSEDSNL